MWTRLLTASCIAAGPWAPSPAAQGLPVPTAGEARATVQALDAPGAPVASFRVAVELDGLPVELELARRSMRARGFQLLVAGADGSVAPHAAAPVRTYRGRVVGAPNARVAGSLREDGLHAFVRLGPERVFGIQPAGDGGHAVYAWDPARLRELACGAVGGVAGSTPAPASAGGPLDVLQLAVDCDHDLYAEQGGSVQATQLEAEGILNAVESIFEADVQVTFELTAIVVRTFEPDPYSGDVFSRLDQMEAEWNGDLAAIPRDLGHGFMGIGVTVGIIGLANIGSLCDPALGFAVTDASFSDAFVDKVVVTAHEIGHNLGAVHCDGAGCKLMCTFFMMCEPDLAFGAQAQADMAAYLAGVSCQAPEADCGAVAYRLSAGNTTSLAATGPVTPGSLLTLVYANQGVWPSTAFTGISTGFALLPAAWGTLLIDPAGIAAVTPGVAFTAPYEDEVETVPIPSVASLAGAAFYLQALHVTAGGPSDLSNGVAVTICP